MHDTDFVTTYLRSSMVPDVSYSNLETLPGFERAQGSSYTALVLSSQHAGGAKDPRMIMTQETQSTCRCPGSVDAVTLWRYFWIKCSKIRLQPHAASNQRLRGYRDDI